MKRNLLYLLVFLFSVSGAIWAQDNPVNKKDSVLQDLKLKKRPSVGLTNVDSVSIKDYKIVSLSKDTTYLDTTLTISKDYKYNYLKRDNFELLRFSNLGQTYNSLAHTFNNLELYPEFGVRAKHFNYMLAEDIKYYNVPTPMTDLFFKTAMEQGQLLDAFLTVNTSRRFNMSIAYKGLRSLGKYQHILASTGNFRITTNYSTKNKKYHLKAHFVSQDLLNQENGGITNKEQFESGADEFTDRSRIDVVFEDAENLLIGKRYFLDHEYFLTRADTTVKTSLSLHHRFDYESKRYKFNQSTNNDYFGSAFLSGEIVDEARLKTLNNTVGVNFTNKALGVVYAGVNHYNYNYYFNNILITPQQTIQNQLKGDEIAFKGSWKNKIGPLQLNANVNLNLSGDLGGAVLSAKAAYAITNDFTLEASLVNTQRMPNFNFLLYQSDYESYNWQNTDTFLKQKNNVLQAGFISNKWGTLQASFNTIDNYAYFGLDMSTQDNPQVLPLQLNSTINYTRVKYRKAFNVGKFTLDNTVMYQNVSQDQEVFNVPEIITRNTLYYSNHVFKRAMYLQTGVTFKYFTKYYANAYNPLIAEFYTQTQEEIGGYPMLDFFVNAKVRQTRIYLKAEHFNTLFSNNNFYSAPNYPYRDFIVRFGLVWNFFR
jgi:hypothetical protein